MRTLRRVAGRAASWTATLGAFSVLAAVVLAGLGVGVFFVVRVVLGIVFGHDS